VALLLAVNSLPAVSLAALFLAQAPANRHTPITYRRGVFILVEDLGFTIKKTGLQY
jgi:hypothetical protein